MIKMRDSFEINLYSCNCCHFSFSCQTFLPPKDYFTVPKCFSPPVLAHILVFFMQLNLFLSMSLMNTPQPKFIPVLTCETFSNSSMIYFEQQNSKSLCHKDITHAEQVASDHNSVSGNISDHGKCLAYPRGLSILPKSTFQCILHGSL